MKKLKLLTSFLIAASMSATMMISANAVQVDISANGSYNNQYVTCTLINKRQDAYVHVKCWNTVASANDIKMTTTSGKHIWSESRSIGFNGSRDYRLGCDHSAYRLYFKTYLSTRSRSGGGADVTNNSNARVTKNY